jgi:SPP1 family holin
MDRGKIIRIILAVVAVVNDGAVMSGIAQFNDETLNKIYAVLSLIATAIALGINHYYNNDYTEEARIGTGMTRMLKMEKREDFIGEKFFTEKGGDDYDDLQNTEQ